MRGRVWRVEGRIRVQKRVGAPSRSVLSVYSSNRCVGSSWGKRWADYKMSRTSQRWAERHMPCAPVTQCMLDRRCKEPWCVLLCEGSAVLAATCLQTKLLVTPFPTCSYEMRVLAALLWIALADGTLASNGQCKAGEERDFSSFPNRYFWHQLFSYLLVQIKCIEWTMVLGSVISHSWSNGFSYFHFSSQDSCSGRRKVKIRRLTSSQLCDFDWDRHCSQTSAGTLKPAASLTSFWNRAVSGAFPCWMLLGRFWNTFEK